MLNANLLQPFGGARGYLLQEFEVYEYSIAPTAER